ncbi:MAG: FAD/FMN-containing dehydrogenase [Gammaproteobacteria bacterium]|jgi:FAD/FMN-containing dehydrogenase
MSTIVDQLIAALGSAQVLSAEAAKQRARSYWDASPLDALAIVRPTSTDELSTALKICHQHSQTVVTHGGLTGCVEGASCNGNDIVISLENMRQIEAWDAVGKTVTLQAGVVLETLQKAAADKQLYFPLDLGARGSCTIGGNIATNAGGINVLRYGMMRQQVLGLEVVLANGQVINSMNQMLKNNAGYDLKQLFIGSEGTLGIVSRAVLKLEEPALSRNSAMIGLSSFAGVTTLLSTLQRSLGGQLSSFEVMWGDYFHAVTEPGFHRAPMARDHAFYVMCEAEGGNPASDDPRFLAVISQTMDAGIAADVVIPQSETERCALWEIRENFEALYEQAPVFLYDISLPMSAMEAYVVKVQSAIQSLWPKGFCQVLGHIADGNLHLFIHPDSCGSAQAGELHQLADQCVYPALAEYGGSVSAEHGIGLEKIEHLGISRSADEIALMKTVKAALDPKGLLNPGKVLTL